MKAAVCSEPGADLIIRELPVPEPGAGELLVQMESCGVCHSDLHLRDGDESLPEESYPLVLGHEGIGRIVELGARTDDAFKLGMRVGLPWIYSACEICQPCRDAQETLCEAQKVRGIHMHGGFAEYALVDSRFAVAIPTALDSLRGSPLLCAGLTAWSALRKVTISSRSNVLIVGAGGLGQYAIGIAKSKGATVFVVDNHVQRLEQARRLGADAVYFADQDVGRKIRQAGGADVAINFAPDTSAWGLIEQSVNPASEIVCVALVYDTVDLSMMWLIDGGHRVTGSSVGSREELAEYLSHVTREAPVVDIEAISLADVNNALDRLKSGDFKGRLCIDFTL